MVKLQRVVVMDKFSSSVLYLRSFHKVILIEPDNHIWMGGLNFTHIHNHTTKHMNRTELILCHFKFL